MGKSIAAMLSVGEGRRFRRPLIVAMSFQPPIPQRVARQQSPPPLRRLEDMLRLSNEDCQRAIKPEWMGVRPPSRGVLFDPERSKLRHAIQTLQPIPLQRLKLASPRIPPTNSAEETFCFFHLSPRLANKLINFKNIEIRIYPNFHR